MVSHVKHSKLICILRQGDPSYPYLFIIYMKIFFRFYPPSGKKIKLYMVLKFLIKVTQFSIFLLTDNCLHFAKADLTECKNILDIIETFSRAFEQLINFDRPGIYFSEKIYHKHQRMMSKLLQIKKNNFFFERL